MTLRMIDCHQHLIYPEEFPYGWAREIPQLAGRAFRYDDYVASVAERGEIRTIFMETSPDDSHWRREAQFVTRLADRPGSIIDGLVLNCRPEEEDDFEAYIESMAHPKLVGFRRILHVMSDDFSQQPRFVDNVRRLEKFDLTFDLCFLARQLPLACRLAAKCPGVQFILGHCGVPDIAAGALNPWRENIRRVAALDNVACKISGVLAYCSPENATADAVRPYVEHCIESFGWDRVVWGGDWPVCCMTADLGRWIDVTAELVSGEDAGNQRKLLVENARRIYFKKEG